MRKYTKRQKRATTIWPDFLLTKSSLLKKSAGWFRGVWSGMFRADCTTLPGESVVGFSKIKMLQVCGIQRENPSLVLSLCGLRAEFALLPKKGHLSATPPPTLCSQVLLCRGFLLFCGGTKRRFLHDDRTFLEAQTTHNVPPISESDEK